MHISVHPLTEGELDATDKVVIAAYNSHHGRKGTLGRYLALQPDGEVQRSRHTGLYGQTSFGFG